MFSSIIEGANIKRALAYGKGPEIKPNKANPWLG
jgi:hypothetical protein